METEDNTANGSSALTPSPQVLGDAAVPTPIGDVLGQGPAAVQDPAPVPMSIRGVLGQDHAVTLEVPTQSQTGEHHPAHTLLDKISTMVAFASPEVNHTVCDLVKRIRNVL